MVKRVKKLATTPKITAEELRRLSPAFKTALAAVADLGKSKKPTAGKPPRAKKP